MSGYNWMYGMSNNAVDAYCSGEKPLSRWRKKDILEKIQEVYPTVYELAKKQPVSILKNFFLFKSSWHHTSKFYNITDFYSFDEDLEIEDIIEELGGLYLVWNYMDKTDEIRNLTYAQALKYKNKKSTYVIEKMVFAKENEKQEIVENKAEEKEDKGGVKELNELKLYALICYNLDTQRNEGYLNLTEEQCDELERKLHHTWCMMDSMAKYEWEKNDLGYNTPDVILDYKDKKEIA